MKMMWCWRCKMEMPMLNEEEYGEIYKMFSGALTAAKESRIENNLPLEGLTIEEIFRPMREKYKEFTNYEETNHIAILHHRISDYGEPCKNCGKPLRTPKASFCAACGQVKESVL
jgi:hypothetical protein